MYKAEAQWQTANYGFTIPLPLMLGQLSEDNFKQFYILPRFRSAVGKADRHIEERDSTSFDKSLAIGNFMETTGLSSCIHM